MEPDAPPAQEGVEDPNDRPSGILYRQGLAAARRGEHDRAVADLERAMEIAPANRRGLVAQALAQALSILACERSDHALARRAVALWKEAANLRVGSDVSRAWYFAGLTMKAALEDRDGAIEAFQRALACEPVWNEWTVLFHLGNALESAGRFDEAVEAHERGLAFTPSDEPRDHHRTALYNMGNALRGGGRLREAVEAYERALAIQPPLDEPERSDERRWLDASILVNLSDAWRELGDRDRRRAYLLKAIFAEPETRGGTAWNNLGNLLDDEGSVAEAIACYERAIACAEHDSLGDAWHNLGRALRAAERDAEALACFHRALASPGFERPAWSMEQIGDYLTWRQQWRGAATILRRVAERVDDASRPCFALSNLGLALLRLGRFDEAERWLRRAATKRDEESHGFAWRLLGKLKIDQGDREEALAAYYAALALARRKLESTDGEEMEQTASALERIIERIEFADENDPLDDVDP